MTLKFLNQIHCSNYSNHGKGKCILIKSIIAFVADTELSKSKMFVTLSEMIGPKAQYSYNGKITWKFSGKIRKEFMRSYRHNLLNGKFLQPKMIAKLERILRITFQLKQGPGTKLSHKMETTKNHQQQNHHLTVNSSRGHQEAEYNNLS